MLLVVLLVTYCIGKHESKIIKKVFRNKLNLVLTSLWLINIIPGLLSSISVKVDIADLVISVFLTSLKLPVCRFKILFTQRY